MSNINAYSFLYQIQIKFNHYLSYIQSDMLEKKSDEHLNIKTAHYTKIKNQIFIVIYKSNP
jgi:hypothetical protein